MGINYKGSQGQTERAVSLQEEEVHLVGFIIRIYHDARSYECQKLSTIIPRLTKIIRSEITFVSRNLR